MTLQSNHANVETQIESLHGDGSSGATRMFAVVSLYGATAGESVTLRTLQVAVLHLAPELGSLKILLYDNTPGAALANQPELPDNVEYYATGKNDGLAAAFNFALQIARRDKCDWLITLDQDTELPSHFLTRIAAIARSLGNDSSIAAIVPQIIGDGRMLSPNRFWAGAIPRWFPRGYVGVPSHPIYAFNSASMLRVSALRQIQGYSPWFWLDNCDSGLFHRLHRYGKQVFVAGDLQLNHEFSMLDKKKRMSVSRYHNVLMSESAFWDLSMNRLAGWERTMRLIGRWCKTAFDGDSRDLRKETARAIKRRLLVPRKNRIDEWKREMEVQRPRLKEATTDADTTAPRISVCMATYNGERFVREQLVSVLSQLGPEDEVIVVDDKSLDSTRETIISLNDARLRLIEHQEQRGIVKSFEHAVRSASGDILFLCDQDDVWAPNKVSRVMKVFAEQPSISLVTTNFSVIDERGRIYPGEKLGRRPFDHRLLPNLLSNRFQGSTMAFRSSLLPSLLPFPKGCHLLHDAWIGLRNTVIGGHCYYLDEDLLFYRRHAHNASRSLNAFQKLLKRSRLVGALLLRSAHTPPS